jgi:hypothetical protein
MKFTDESNRVTLKNELIKLTCSTSHINCRKFMSRGIRSARTLQVINYNSTHPMNNGRFLSSLRILSNNSCICNIVSCTNNYCTPRNCSNTSLRSKRHRYLNRWLTNRQLSCRKSSDNIHKIQSSRVSPESSSICFRHTRNSLPFSDNSMHRNRLSCNANTTCKNTVRKL